jgi:hypothetical protein
VFSVQISLKFLSRGQPFFPPHTILHLDFFLICRPWKFATLGPGPFGPCVNTTLTTVVNQLSQHYTAWLLQSSLGMKGLKGTQYLSKYTKALFYAVVVLLTKWESINNFPIRNNVTVGCLRQSSHWQPLHICTRMYCIDIFHYYCVTEVAEETKQ